MKTEHRPVPLPGQAPAPGPPGQQSRPRTASRGPNGKMNLPAGAAAFSWHYAGPDGKTLKARKRPVPVSDGGELTHHEMH